MIKVGHEIIQVWGLHFCMHGFDCRDNCWRRKGGEQMRGCSVYAATSQSAADARTSSRWRQQQQQESCRCQWRLTLLQSQRGQQVNHLPDQLPRSVPSRGPCLCRGVPCLSAVRWHRVAEMRTTIKLNDRQAAANTATSASIRRTRTTKVQIPSVPFCCRFAVM